MAKRGFKLFAWALAILVGRSIFCLVEIPRVTQVNSHKSPRRTTRLAILDDLQQWAGILDPFATVTGVSLKDIWTGIVDADSALRSISTLKSLAQFRGVQTHAEDLAKTLVESTQNSSKARNVFLTNVSLPIPPVNDTEFQRLVYNVLSDVTLTGVSSIHAEAGIGKTVAVVLAMLGWAQGNQRSVTVLVTESLGPLKEFFKVEDMSLVPHVAKAVFPLLFEAGVRLQLVLDNIFDKEIGADGQMLMSLARAAHTYGQVIVVTQSEAVAKEIDNLNGARTRLAPQQENVNVCEYRWNEMQAKQLLFSLNATKEVTKIIKLETREAESKIEKAVQTVFDEFGVGGDDGFSTILDSTRTPGGGWKPVDIKEFLLTGKKPAVSAGGTPATPSKTVWVCLLKKDGARFKPIGKPFKVKGELQDVDDLKKAIVVEEKLSIAASKVNVYTQQDGKWVLEDKMSASLRETDESDCYGYTVP